MMSLICGRLGKCPCPMCLVSLDELHDLAKSFPARFQEQAETALKAYATDRSTGNDILKSLELRPVTVHKIILLLMSG